MASLRTHVSGTVSHVSETVLSELSTIPDPPAPDAPDAPDAPEARPLSREHFIQQYMSRLVEQHTSLMASSVYDIVSVITPLDKKVDSLDKKVQSLDKKLDKEVRVLGERVDTLEVALKRKIDDNQSELMGLLRGLSAEVREGFTHLESQLKRES